ncbi:hypothetical protein L6452_25375 [Arctium lappa]|uniref:Uncharacterized protein n=1 Tax=Arctium lappa TaxID=4217 RepID=A0ACB9ABY9_ARCLA|nr:hypothetical protein L6452_25375 [Arctium lappa]
MSPLVSSALECGLVYSFLLPVFYQGFCVGVVECSRSSPCQLLEGFNELNIALESVGFKTFHVRERLPFKVSFYKNSYII